jgi:hypothetical protein
LLSSRLGRPLHGLTYLVIYRFCKIGAQGGEAMRSAVQMGSVVVMLGSATAFVVPR